jgi:large subunit ribosomal protein L10
MENRILQPEQVEKIAMLPPREHLLAQLAGAFEGPMAALASALEGKVQEMAGLLDALKAERESTG